MSSGKFSIFTMIISSLFLVFDCLIQYLNFYILYFNIVKFFFFPNDLYNPDQYSQVSLLTTQKNEMDGKLRRLVFALQVSKLSTREQPRISECPSK